ncbi:uncharacterized protein LOC141892769 isoform X2 [Acropora palmata]|uniref:uncharacterized protein LOC141892769 isoform X2 n=1 Tax=Acropora palmata TaxID=6131 RepID=UPI003DA02D0E
MEKNTNTLLENRQMVQATTVFTNNSPRTVTHIKKSDWEQIVILSYGNLEMSADVVGN